MAGTGVTKMFFGAWLLLGLVYSALIDHNFNEGILNQQHKISVKLENRLHETTSKLLNYLDQFESVTLKNEIYDITIISQLTRMNRVLPVQLYEFLDEYVGTIVRSLLPREQVEQTLIGDKRSILTHFSFLERVIRNSPDFRSSAITRLQYLQHCFDERYSQGKMAIDLYYLLGELQDIQYRALEEMTIFELPWQESMHHLNYIDTLRKLLEVYLPCRQYTFETIGSLIAEFHHDLVAMSETDLEQEIPKGLSENFILIFANRGILADESVLAHHEICWAARRITFKHPIPEVTPGKYLAAKKNGMYIPDITITFAGLEDELEYRNMMLSDCQGDLMTELVAAWIPTEVISYRFCVMDLYATTFFSQKVMVKAEEERSNGKYLEGLSLLYQALFIQMSGLQITAKALLPKSVSSMFQPYVVICPQLSKSVFLNQFNVVLGMYETNFRVVRDQHPQLADAIFNAIEICRMMNYSLAEELEDDQTLQVFQYSKWMVCFELINYLSYWYPLLEKHGLFTEWSKVKLLVKSGEKHLSHIFEKSLLLDRSFGLMNIFLLEFSSWKNLRHWPKILDEIPEPYKCPKQKMKRYSPDAVLLRWSKSLITRNETQVKEVAVTDDTSAGIPKDQTGDTRIRGKIKPKMSKIKKSKRRPRKSKGSKQENAEWANANDAEENTGDDEARDVPEMEPIINGKEAFETSFSESDKQDSQVKYKSPGVWRNADSILLPTFGAIKAAVEVKNSSEPLEDEPEVPPTHFSAIIKLHGYSNVQADPRDIAYGILLVGERIWKKHLEHLMAAFEEHELGSMIQLFKYSIEKFEHEMALLEVNEPELFIETLMKANLTDLDHLSLCLKFYKQRLSIAHPHVPRVATSKNNLTARHLTVLEFSHRLEWHDIETWRERTKCSDHIYVSSISNAHRSKLLIDSDFTEYALAVLGIYEIAPLEDLLPLRNSLAHQRVQDNIFRAYLEYVFSDHCDILFLESLLK